MLALSHAQMSVTRTRKQSDLEKKLSILERQLYGKTETSVASHQTSDKKLGGIFQIETEQHPASSRNSTKTDDVFLKQDLLKIVLFSTLAFGAELGIYFSHIYTRINLF